MLLYDSLAFIDANVGCSELSLMFQVLLRSREGRTEKWEKLSNKTWDQNIGEGTAESATARSDSFYG